MGIQFCGKCGHPLIPDQLFCQHCGERVDENATRAAAAVAGSVKATPGGTLYCGECGSLMGSKDTVCRRCGARIARIQGVAVDQSLSDAPTFGEDAPFPAASQSGLYQGAPPGSGPASPAGKPSSWASNYDYLPHAGQPDAPSTFVTGASLPPGAAPPVGSRRISASEHVGLPYTPGSYPAKQRGPRWPLVLALFLVALAMIVGGGIFLVLHQANAGGQTNNPTATPGVVLNEQTAGNLIKQFYNDINARQYDNAYDLLSHKFQQSQSRQNFKDGFNNTLHDTITIQSAQVLADGSVQVNVSLQAQESRNGTQATSNYAGYYIVIKENEQLLIDVGHLDPQSS